MCASSGWATIGASTPSTSSRTAERSGSLRSGSSQVSSAASVGGIRLVCRAMPRVLALAVVGTAAGAFSGLFGVGGGVVMVPLLILWLGYGEREATATSLAAIAVIAACAAAFQGAYGNVDLAKGVLIGLPAVGGVVARHGAAAADPDALDRRRLRRCSSIVSGDRR